VGNGGSKVLTTILLIVHGLVAVALLGAITHQTLSAWAWVGGRPSSFFGRFRSVPSASFANAVVILYAVSTLLGGFIYLYFRVDVRPELERAGHWYLLAFLTSKNTSSRSGWRCYPHTGFVGVGRVRMSVLECARRSLRYLP
jgi:hypothetical protein